MRRSAALGFASTFLVPALAWAQPVSGLYVGAGAGGNFIPDPTVHVQTHQNAYVIGSGSRAVTVPAMNTTQKGTQSLDAGAIGVGSVGFGFGNGLRVEGEGSYRYNSRSSGTYDEQKFGAMANVLYDFSIGVPVVTPYIGAGAGYMWADRGYTLGRTNSFAYQGIMGVATPIPWLPGLSATLEYRFLDMLGTKRSGVVPTTVTTITQTGKYNGEFNHSVLLGVRYAFNQPALPRPEVLPPVVPAVAASRTYLVFFDWDRSDLTDRARQIIAEAAQASSRVKVTRIEVQGNADKSGTPAYNQRLSLRRAQTVATELVRQGVARTAIDIQAFGDTRPLVPTAAGVREPQNRRVAIILR